MPGKYDLKHELMIQIDNMIFELNNEDFSRIWQRCDNIKKLIINPDYIDKGDKLK